MSQNLIDLHLDDEALRAIDAAMGVLETHLGGLVALTPELRREMIKMGDKSEAFCRQALIAFAQNPDVLPRSFDVAACQRDLAALERLRPLRHRLARLQERVTDTEMALGSDLISNAYEGYAVLKVSGRGAGLTALRQMLAARFSRGRRAVAAEAAPG